MSDRNDERIAELEREIRDLISEDILETYGVEPDMVVGYTTVSSAIMEDGTERTFVTVNSGHRVADLTHAAAVLDVNAKAAITQGIVN